MSILDEIKEAINETFLDEDSAFRPSTLYVITANTGLDPQGASGVFSCRAFRDDFSAYERNVFGIPDTSSKIMMLQTNDEGLELSVSPGCQIVLEDSSRWGVVRVLTRDPAGATWAMEASEI